jgi:glucose/arabinose dehydrogenase
MTSAVRKNGSAPTTRRRAPVFPSAVPTLLLLAFLALPGCGRGPQMLPPELRKTIDRSVVERPANYDFERFIENLTAPTAMAFDTDRNALLVAESGVGGGEPRILGFSYTDASTFTVYPQGRAFFGLRSNPFRMYGPIGGMTVRDGVIYVSHRDEDDFGVISAVTYDGKGRTVVAGLPARGDYGVTDVVFGPYDRLYFGVGSATNSGVVGLDNWKSGWVREHPDVADLPYNNVRSRGSRFFTPNPAAGLFSGSERAITAPYSPFGEYIRSLIDAPRDGKPNAAIYSVLPTGGVDEPDLRVEAHGIRLPAGLAFEPGGSRLYTTNQGMELRGTRPVLNDPNTVLYVSLGSKQWYGWPDFSADLQPITLDKFQPFPELLRGTGYTELNFLLDHVNPPTVDDRELLVRARFAPLSGAAKMTFIPREGPFAAEFGGQLIVALSGDRAPFATSGSKRFRGPVGYRVMRVDVDRGSAFEPHDFIRNTAGVPRSRTKDYSPEMLERPMDVKIGPDGYLYVLDFGRMEVRNGRERVTRGTGQVFRLKPAGEPTAQPAGDDAQTAGTQVAQ